MYVSVKSLYMTVGLELTSVCGWLKSWTCEDPGLLIQEQSYRQKCQGWELGGKQERLGQKSNKQCCLKMLFALSEDNLSQYIMVKDFFRE